MKYSSRFIKVVMPAVLLAGSLTFGISEASAAPGDKTAYATCTMPTKKNPPQYKISVRYKKEKGKQEVFVYQVNSKRSRGPAVTRPADIVITDGNAAGIGTPFTWKVTTDDVWGVLHAHQVPAGNTAKVLVRIGDSNARCRATVTLR